MKDEWGGSTFPIVPGHEIAGIVSQVGVKASHYKAGDRVGEGALSILVVNVRLVAGAYSNIVQKDVP